MHEYGTTREHLGAVAVTERAYAALNPRAVLQKPMTMQDYLEARTISTPLALFDCDMPIDGSIAIVVSAPDTVADLKHWATIDAVGTAMSHRPYWEQWPDLTTMAAHDAARHMWAQTTLRPADVDVAQIYDAFSPFVIFWREAMGFCGRGEGGLFVADGTCIGPVSVAMKKYPLVAACRRTPGVGSCPVVDSMGGAFSPRRCNSYGGRPICARSREPMLSRSASGEEPQPARCS
jgi:hypothetical protein